MYGDFTTQQRIKLSSMDFYIKIITIDEDDAFNVGRYELCKDGGDIPGDVFYEDFYYTNSRGRWKEANSRGTWKDEEDSDDDVEEQEGWRPMSEQAIFHLYYNNHCWHLKQRLGENTLLSLSSGRNRYHHEYDDEVDLTDHVILPPAVGWRHPHTGNPFFLAYYFKPDDDFSDEEGLPPAL